MKKRITALALAAAMVLGTVALAAGAEKAITVTPMSLTINGQTVTPTKSDGSAAEVFAYDGATYVPLRYLSELLGLNVEWDKNDPTTAKVTGNITLPAGGNGTYTGTAQGFAGAVTATITVVDGKITACTLAGAGETPAIGGAALEKLQAQVLAAGNADIDGVAGATYTSNGVKEAVKAALNAASGVTVGAMVYKAGTYSATVDGMHGPMTVEVTVGSDRIEKVEVTSEMETPGLIDWPASIIPQEIVDEQSLAVDTITGVTVSSRAILKGVETALTSAGMDVAPLKQPIQKEKAADSEYTADVIIVGGGGAGMAAAISATEEGASVILIEKTGFLGGNSIVVGGLFNCPDPEEQDYADITPHSLDSLIEDALAEKPVSDLHAQVQATVKKEFEAYKNTDKHLFDSPSWFALQTWNGGDKVGDLDMLTFYAERAFPTMEWLESMGMEYDGKVTAASGSLYMRAHYPVTPNGSGYFTTFRSVLNERSDLYTQLMNTEGKSLIMDGDKVVGVNAVSKDGSTVTLHANQGVILATGGFAGNVELRQKYCEGEKWPDLSGKLGTTNMPSVTGDGIFMAQAAGANLINMEQIQLLPYTNPWTGATTDLITGRMASMYINKNGERFVREDGRRDEMSKAILAQPDGMMYQFFSADDVPDGEATKTLGGKTLGYHLEHPELAGYVKADTLEGLAEILDIDPVTLQNTVNELNSYVRGEKKDPYGRVTWSDELLNGPWYAYPLKPAAHHTMGGVDIDQDAHAKRADGSIIEGLYCAGEITGNLHGANRIGGNAIVDFCVFGRIAGTNAATNK